ncbi:MAG: M48 family metalloprotease [Dehalococcoidia bacterium]
MTRSPRPNPFAFPSDTTFRFALLVAAVFGATLYVWNWMWIVLGADQPALFAAASRCLSINEQGLTVSSTFNGCVRAVYADATWWMLGGLALVLAVAVVLLLTWPALKQRRARYRPLDREDAPDALEALTELSREAGLSSPPRWVWSPLRRDASAVAFGYPGRYTVALTGGLVVRHTTDPAAFRAVIRHELAHIRNRDVLTTYATLAFWYAFLLAAVLPFAFTLIDEGQVAISVTWRLLVLAALVYLTRNAVLRSREVYADVRASLTDGPEGALGRVVSALPPQDRRFPRSLLALHPSPEQRAAALQDTQPLFELGAMAAFAAGLSATVNFDSVHRLLTWWFDDPIGVAIVAALVFAPLVVGVVGLALWRGGLAALTGGGSVGAVWPVALALSAGMVIGPELSLADAVAPSERNLLSELLHGEGLLWVAALAGLMLLLLTWIASGASVWLRSLAAQPPHYAALASMVIAAGVFAIILGAYFTLRDLSPVLSYSRGLTALDHEQISSVTEAGPRWLWQFVMDPLTLLLIERTVLPLAVVLLWAFPLAVVLVQRRRTGDAPWAFLEPGGAIEAERPRLRLVRPLLVGAGVGGASLLALLLYRAGVHGNVDWPTRRRDEFVLAFVFWQVVIALVAQGAAGAIAAGWARDTVRLPEALCAATVAGSIAVFGIVTGPVAGGCIDSLSIRPGPCEWNVSAGFTFDMWRHVISQGAAVAIVAALVVLAVRSLVEGRTRSAPDGELQVPA